MKLILGIFLVALRYTSGSERFSDQPTYHSTEDIAGTPLDVLPSDYHDGQVPDISEDPNIFTSTELPGNMRYMATVGNGHLASTILSDTVYMNGLYTGSLGESYRARIPSIHSSNFSEVVDHTTGAVTWSLDTTRAVFEQKLTAVRTSDHIQGAELVYRVYTHHRYSRLLITEVQVTRVGPLGLPITVRREAINTGSESADLVLNDTQLYENPAVGCDSSAGILCYERSGLIVTPETPTSGQTPVHLFWRDMPLEFSLNADDVSQTWTYVLAADDNLDVARENFDQGMTFASAGDSAGLFSSHQDNWATVWSSGSITLEGDPSILSLQKVIRGSFYYLYSSLPSHLTLSERNQFFGLSPGGLANGEPGRDYYGHMFWDMETWMYPAILLFRPDLAREMLSYRIYGMNPAFDRAASGGYQGTRFPWESAFSGVEVTPDICIPCRENQQHITGDISFAARQYISATRDEQWLVQLQGGAAEYTGYDFVHNMAQFWFSRPTYNATKDRYDINGVMPPDEHQQNINNSVYTNIGAALAVHFARYASCLAGRDPVTDVPDEWISLVQNLAFPFNTEKRYHEEYEGYEQDAQTNNTHPSGVKQADVVLLSYPFLWEMPDDVRRNDLVEYERVTSPGGPAMTWGMYAVGWLDVGDDEKAAELFDRAYQRYYREPFKVWTEAQQGAGAINFITGMGGFLQAVISGYGGLRLQVEQLQFRQPKLPVNVTRMTFHDMNYLGSRLDLDFTDSEITVEAVEVGDLPLQVHLDDGSSFDIIQDTPLSFLTQPFSINTTVASGCPLPMDNIDVDYGPMTP